MTNPLTMKRSVLGLLIGALFLSGCAVQMPDMKTMAEEAAPGAWSVSCRPRRILAVLERSEAIGAR